MKQVLPKLPQSEIDRDLATNPEAPELKDRRGEYFGSILNRAIKRRAFLKGAGVTGASSAALVVTPTLFTPSVAAARGFPSWGDPSARLIFETVPPGNAPDIVVPPGYEFNVIIRWGDPLFPDAPAFDVDNQNPTAQSRQFGFNCDLVLWYPLPGFVQRAVELRRGQLGPLAQFILGILFPHFFHSSNFRALVAVNHEYTSDEDMFPGYNPNEPTPTQCETEIEAHGVSIIEIEMRNGCWYRVRPLIGILPGRPPSKSRAHCVAVIS